jgi:hypothetical protein
VLLLFCLHLPWGEGGDGLRYWWDRVAERRLAVFYFCVLAVGLSLFFLAPALKGAARAWTYQGMGALGFVFLIAAGPAVPVPLPALLLGMLVPALCTMLLVSILFSRLLVSAVVCPGPVQAGAGALTILVTLGIAGAWGASVFGSSPDGMTVWLVIAVVFAATGHLAAVACGSLSVAGGLSEHSRGMTRTAMIFGAVALIMPVAVAPLAGYGYADAGPASARFALLQALRLTVMAYALIGLCGIGLLEWLVSSAAARTGSA